MPFVKRDAEVRKGKITSLKTPNVLNPLLPFFSMLVMNIKTTLVIVNRLTRDVTIIIKAILEPLNISPFRLGKDNDVHQHKPSEKPGKLL